MIFSNTHHMCVLSPPRTGTKYRFARYHHVITRFPGYYWHAFPSQIHQHVAESTKEFKFYCFVRNPWRRFISMYNMMSQNKSTTERESGFNIAATQYRLAPMHQYYCDDTGDVFVDRVMKLENMNDELAYIEKTHGITPNEQENNNTKYTIDYNSLWTQQSIDKIAEMEAKTIDLMGYTF